MTMFVPAITSVSMPYAPAAGTSAVSVSTALASMATTRSGTLVIEDTADNISRNLDALQAGRVKIASMKVTDNLPITISTRQLRADADALAKITTYSLAITGATAADVKTLVTNTKVASIAVKDSVVNIGTNLDALQANVSKLSEIRQSGPARSIDISATQLSSASAALAKIADTYSLNVRGVSVANLDTVAADNHVRGIGIVDTSSNIASNLDLLQSYGVKLLSAESSDKAAMEVTADQVKASALTLGKIYGGYQLNVHNASLADLASLSRNSKVKSIEVRDSAENVANNLSALKRLGSSLSAITITNPSSSLTMSAKQYTAFNEVLRKISTAGVSYALSKASIANAAALTGDAAVTAIAVTDTSNNLSSGLATLAALNTRLTSITRTGASTPLSLTATQLSTYGTTLAKIGNAYSLAVSDVAAADAGTIAAMGNVSAFSVADSSSNIASAWDGLTATPVMAKLKQVTQTGTAAPLALSSAQISRGSALLSKFAGSVQLAASSVSAANAATLAKDTRISAMNVSDTSDNLSKYFDTLDGLGTKVASIAVSDISNPLAITASQLRTKTATLAKISGNYSLAVRLAFSSDAATIATNTKVSSIAVADTGANLSSNLSTLTGLGNKIAKIDMLGKTPITISANNLSASAGTLAKISNEYSMVVTDVAAGDAKAMAIRDRVVGLTVSDSSANIATNLADLNAIGSELSTITQSTVAAMEINVADLLANGKVLDKLSNGYQLKVSGVSVKQAGYVATLRNVTELNIADNGNAIQTNFDRLVSLNPLIGTITQSDSANALKLTSTQRAAAPTLLDKINSGSYTLSITDARAAEAATLAADTHVKSMRVVDTAFNVSQNLAGLKSAITVASGSSTVDKLDGIVLAGGSNVSIIAAQIPDYESVLSHISSPYQLDVTDASASGAAALANRSDLASLSVSDSSSAIASNLDALQSLGKKLKSIAQSGTPAALSLDGSQLTSDAAALAKISNRYTIAARNVSAEAAARIATHANVATIDVVDSSDNIASRIDSLQQAVTKINSVTQSGTPAALQITNAQRSTNAEVLAKLDTYTLALRDVAAADAGSMQSDALVTRFSVTDSSDNISRNFDTLVAAGSKLTDIVQSGSAAPIELSLQQYTNNTATLNKIVNNYGIAVIGVDTASATSVAAHANVASVDISDTIANVTAQLEALNALGSKLKAIRLSDSGSPLQMSAARYLSSRSTLGRIAGSYSLSISNASAEQATAIAADPAVAKLTVSDSSAKVSANIDQLAALGTELDSVTLADLSQPVVISLAQLNRNASLLAKMSGAYQLDVRGVSAEKATAVASQAHVSSVSVSDSSANLIANLSALQALGSSLQSVTLTDNLTPLALSSAQWTGAADTLNKISNGFRANLSGVSASDAATFAADVRVNSMQVTDSGNAIGQNLNNLQSLGNKLQDITLSGGSTIKLDVGQLKASSNVIAKIRNGYTLAVGNVATANAAAIGARADVGSFTVSDSGTNLSKYWNVLQPLASKIVGIAQTDTSPIAISATQYAQAATLTAKLDSSYQLSVADVSAANAATVAADTHVTSLSVTDTAANLSDDPTDTSDFLSALIGIKGTISAIKVTDGGMLALSATQLQNNADLLAKISTGYSLSVWGAAAADATGIAADSKVAEIAVADSSSNIAGQIGNLQALGTRLVNITQTGSPSVMSLTATQVANNAATLNKISGNYSLAVSDASTAYALQLIDPASSTASTIATITVKDSGANVASALDDLQAAGKRLTGISLTGSTPTLPLSGTQFVNHEAVLSKLSGANISISAAQVSQIAAMTADSRVVGIALSDSSTNISAGFDTLVNLGSTLTSIAITGAGTALSLTATQYANGGSTLAKISSGHTLSVSGMGAADAVAATSDTTLTQVSVSDTAANIAAQLTGLNALGARLQTLQQTDSGNLPVTVTQFSTASSLWPKFVGTLSLSVSNAKAADVANLTSQSYVGDVTVSDTAANVSTNWDDLSTNVNKLQPLGLSDNSAVSLSAQQLQTGAALVAKLPTGYALSVSEVGADDAQTIAARTDVSDLSIADTADNIINALGTMDSITKLLAFTVTDATTLELTSDQQSTYATLLAKLDPAITITTLA